MSESCTHVVPGDLPNSTETLRNVSKIQHNKTPRRKKGQKMINLSGTPPMCNDLQSPRQRASRYPGLNHGDSPGEQEPSQDIFWDCTSPTQPALGHKNRKAVEISDIVNRIAPKNIKSKGKESSLLLWIGDGDTPCTPVISKPRVRKRSTRMSSVNDLMKLARQFDENMQQDEQSSEQLNTVSNHLNEHVNTSQTKPLPSHVKDLSSSSGRVEAELHALFDSSTQRVSGNLSEASACSQEMNDQPVTSAVAQHQPSELDSADKRYSAAHPAGQRGARMHNTNSCDDFDDDWENDDLLNDSFVLAMTHNPDEQPGAKPKPTFHPDNKTNAPSFSSVCKPATNPSSSLCKMNSNTFQELWSKLKTSNRSSFKLELNPPFRPKSTDDVSKLNSTADEPKSNLTHQKYTHTGPKPEQNTDNHNRFLKDDTSDSVWDDWGDDALLYQVCDSVEKSSNSQPQQVNPSNPAKKQHIDELKKTTELLQFNTTQYNKTSSSRKSSHTFIRCNSLPGPSCKAGNYKGWNIPMKSENKKSGMSQSFPGNNVSLGTLSSSGTFQPENTDATIKHLQTREPQKKSHQTSYKRNVSDSETINNKVFVTSQGSGKCSAAEIERKKQEALARRRLRSQNVSK